MRRIRIMNKIQGYDEAQAYTGESRALPAGKYICEIKGAKEVETKNGKKQLVLQLDIAEGEYKDFYSDQFSKTIKEKGTAAKWNNGVLVLKKVMRAMNGIGTKKRLRVRK